jgi:hypothetical protein
LKINDIFKKNLSHDSGNIHEKKGRGINRKAEEGQVITVYFNYWDKLTAGGLKIS